MLNLRSVVLSVGLLVAVSSQAEEASQLAEVKTVLTRYLDFVKAKKWQECKKLTHPETIKTIESRKKRLGQEDHPMAPWFFEKSAYYLKAYRISKIEPGAQGTYVIETSENDFMVEEKGMAMEQMATYLMGRKDGKWYVVDKRRQETFTQDSIRLGYKNYFDAESPPPEN